MSVPAWKQAILERRKKEEDEEKKKQAEKEAYLATLPPWKRALIQKREREKQQQEQAKEKATGAAAERSGSFQKRQQQLAQERDERARQTQEPGREQSRGWGGRRVTPPSTAPCEREPASPPAHGHSHQFFSSSSSSSSQQPDWAIRVNQRRASVTTLPGADEPIAARVAASTVPAAPRSRASSESATSTPKKVVSSVKKLSQNQSGQQVSEMPAWKKALLERRREKERAAGGVRPAPSPTEVSAGSTSQSPTSREPPQDGVGTMKTDSDHSNTLSLQRQPSPNEDVVFRDPVPEPAGLKLQRKWSPNEQTELSGTSENMAKQLPKQTERNGSHVQADLMKFEPKSPVGFVRKPSPTESVSTHTSSRTQESSSVATKKSFGIGDSSEPKGKPTPVRAAPVAPTPSGTRPTPRAQSGPGKQPVSSLTRPRPMPEVVNRGGATETPSYQSQVMQTEGVAHRAPVFKEVAEWADVSEEDEKFRKLPAWKQALIRRRRADIASRKGHTTSVDDVPLSNGPVPPSSNKSTTQGVQSADRTNNVPPWKKQLMEQRVESGGPTGQNVMSNFEKKHLSTKRAPPVSTNANVKALLGRFNKQSTAPPAPPVTEVTNSHALRRSPSPSSSTPAQTPPSSSRPPHSTTDIPSPSDKHRPRKSFTWTPGEDSMPGEALSDSSDGEEEEEEEEVTNLDDTSESEEEEEEKEGEEVPSVVLLQPPKRVATPEPTEAVTQKVRKTSSILVSSSRPRKKVSSRTLRACMCVCVLALVHAGLPNHCVHVPTHYTKAIVGGS